MSRHDFDHEFAVPPRPSRPPGSWPRKSPKRGHRARWISGVIVGFIALMVVIANAADGSKTKHSAASPATAPPVASTPTSMESAPVTPAPTLASKTPPPAAAPAPSSDPSSVVTSPATSPSPAAASSSSTCHARGTGIDVLPDPVCTPGATNPAVTQATISSTICVSGWTSTVRPPESYTENLKRQQMTTYGDTGPISSYEEDHLIPLELGGSPSSPENLWPEPGASPNPKDAVEDAAKSAVCHRDMTLAAAQQAMASNWMALGQHLGA